MRWKSMMESVMRITSLLSESDDSDGKAEKELDAGLTTKDQSGLPSSAAVFLARLKQQQKELYKDPPQLPPPHITVEEKTCPLPIRDTVTGRLTFAPGHDNNEAVKFLLRDFHPNQTPEEVLRGGSFGGTYFRPIVSAVTNRSYSSQQAMADTIPDPWITGLDKKMMLCSTTYRVSVNKFKAKCGGSLGMWESSGWISDADPYGWFQWYCRFYQGRRCSDDARQISRWKGLAGPTGRFRNQLCNKIMAAKTTAQDNKISPVIRQTLFHWGLLITDDILEDHLTRKPRAS